MGTLGATRLCWTILGFLLLQGHNSQPTTTQLPNSQGNFSSLSVTTMPTSASTGDSSSLEYDHSSTLVNTSTSAAPELNSNVSMETSKTVSPSWSTKDNQTVLDLSQVLTHKYTSTLDIFQNVTSKTTTMSLSTRDLTILPSPTSETVLTVAAFGVISFIVILVVVVIILVSVVSLRFKCRKNKESEDPQKPGSSGISESCSTVSREKDSITLISMKNINMNNSKGCLSTEKVL